MFVKLDVVRFDSSASLSFCEVAKFERKIDVFSNDRIINCGVLIVRHGVYIENIF